jgi:hypothetical protein
MPIEVKHALSGSNVAEWRIPTCSKLAALHRKDTVRMENLPHGRSAIGNKWVFKVKAKPDGSFDRFKARLVSHGFCPRA